MYNIRLSAFKEIFMHSILAVYEILPHMRRFSYCLLFTITLANPDSISFDLTWGHDLYFRNPCCYY